MWKWRELVRGVLQAEGGDSQVKVLEMQEGMKPEIAEHGGKYKHTVTV